MPNETKPTEYPLDKRVADQIGRAFTYHPPKGDQQERYGALREMAREFAFAIAAKTPPGREQALALTKLEECVMFANAAIARGE
jgi:hypothetical protein